MSTSYTCNYDQIESELKRVYGERAELRYAYIDQFNCLKIQYVLPVDNLQQEINDIYSMGYRS